MWLDNPTLAHLRDVAEWPDLGERYEIRGRIGRGGMGVVYQAHDRALQRDVAVKVLDDLHRGADAERLMGEARILGQLEHPGIVPVHDVGKVPDGRVFYVMKLVRGDRLDAALASRSLNQRLELFLRICDAVSFAHARGIVHRDLKPENIMLGAFGEVLVLDWGIASAETTASAESAARAATRASAEHAEHTEDAETRSSAEGAEHAENRSSAESAAHAATRTSAEDPEGAETRSFAESVEHRDTTVFVRPTGVDVAGARAKRSITDGAAGLSAEGAEGVETRASAEDAEDAEDAEKRSSAESAEHVEGRASAEGAEGAEDAETRASAEDGEHAARRTSAEHAEDTEKRWSSGQVERRASHDRRGRRVSASRFEVTGTPGYMAPEQQSGSRRIDQRADVYALGVILAALTPAPAPKPLAAIAARAREAAVSARYQTVQDLARDVVRFRDGDPVGAYQESPIERLGRIYRRYQLPILLVAAYVIMRIVLLAWRGV